VTDPDALVVGAGPAGSIAALVLARAGLRVHLVDRARFPRPKLCGDTLNPGSLAILDSLHSGLRAPVSGGAEPGSSARRPQTEVRSPELERGSLANLVRERALPITGMMVTGPNGACVTADYPGALRGAAITRASFDLLLIEAAVEAGVHFDHGLSVRAPIVAADGTRIEGAHAASPRAGHALRARIVIAADGRASRLASALKLSAFAAKPRRWAFGAYFTDVAGMSARGEMHVRPDGYIGMAPLPDRLTNVCVVRELSHHDHSAAIDQRRVIADAVRADAILRDRFAQSRQVSDVTVLGPLAVQSSASGCAGLLLAGDAAGFVDPMTGDGLRFALRGGVLAAEAALCELASGAPAFRALHARRVREFSRKWQINRALRALVGSPRGVQMAALIASHWGAPVRYLVGVAGDVALANATGADAEARSLLVDPVKAVTR
jgi:flavin-dependent dehydrogenase